MVTYDASSGTFPQSPCWKLTDTADPEEPLLQSGKLVLGTSQNGENMGYRWDSTLYFPSTFVFEARLKLGPGSAATNERAQACLVFGTGPFAGNSLWIDHDDIFLLASNSVRADSAVVDTDDAFHTYRIEVTGTTVGSQVEVYYDAEVTPRLQHVLIDDPAVTSPEPWLFFGEGSILASGQTEWELVSHNAGPVYCCGQENSCGNNEELVSVGVGTQGIYDANNGDSWAIELGGVPAGPSAGLLIYGFGAAGPATPITTPFGNLCLSPFQRGIATLPDLTTGGCANPTRYSWDVWAAFVDSNKAAGTKGFSAAGTDEVWIQAWHRDPQLPSGGSFSQLAGPFLVVL